MIKKCIACLFYVFLLFSNDLTIMYWNMENLFDLVDDPITKDEDYTPQSQKRYTYRAYELKMDHVAQVINSVHPDILAMVEVENQTVLEDLRKRLRNSISWEIIIDDGPDVRGIDPAMMYRSDKVEFCDKQYHPVYFQEDNYHSRDIMQVEFKGINTDFELCLFLNHWPSRRGGKETSNSRRIFAAKQLETAVKNYYKYNWESQILITGDFNDDYCDNCLQYLICEAGMTYLFKTSPKKIHGTYCHNGEWVSFDHFLTYSPRNLNLGFVNPKIVAPYWIRDKLTHGPYRFYQGTDISGGYSDHFPITIQVNN